MEIQCTGLTIRVGISKRQVELLAQIDRQGKIFLDNSEHLPYLGPVKMWDSIKALRKAIAELNTADQCECSIALQQEDMSNAIIDVTQL